MANFDQAIPQVLANEGGYVNDPKDPGGETNFGISKRTYPNVDIKNLTKEQAEAIYRRDFWLFDGLTSQLVANKLFDAYVNERHNAIRWAQEIVGTEVDGIYGGDTEHHINLMDEMKFISCFRQWWINHILKEAETSPVVQEDLKGLLRRARQ